MLVTIVEETETLTDGEETSTDGEETSIDEEETAFAEQGLVRVHVPMRPRPVAHAPFPGVFSKCEPVQTLVHRPHRQTVFRRCGFVDELLECHGL